MTRLQRRRAGPRGDVRLLLAPATPRTLQALRPWLHPEDLYAARLPRQMARRRAFLVGRALLRRLVADQEGIAPRRTRLRLIRNHRPRHHATHRRRLALSLSHAAGWVLAAAAPGATAGRCLGVDIESRARPLNSAIARRLPGGDARTSAPTIGDWCLAEALLKADGRGITALPQLRIDMLPARGLSVRAMLNDRSAGNLIGLPLSLGCGRLVGAIALATHLPSPQPRQNVQYRTRIKTRSCMNPHPDK